MVLIEDLRQDIKLYTTVFLSTGSHLPVYNKFIVAWSSLLLKSGRMTVVQSGWSINEESKGLWESITLWQMISMLSLAVTTKSARCPLNSYYNALLYKMWNGILKMANKIKKDQSCSIHIGLYRGQWVGVLELYFSLFLKP